MRRVWGYSAALDTGTVTVHMRRLREKIEARPLAPTPPRDGLGRGLPVRAVIELAVLVTLATLTVGLAVAFGLQPPPHRSPSARRARVPRGRPAAGCGAPLGLGDVPHGRRREDPRSGGRLGFGCCHRGPPPGPVDRDRDRQAARLVGVACRRRPRRSSRRTRPGRAGRAGQVLQRDGGGPRAHLRRTARARRLGKPRPAHSDRVAPGHAGGDRGRDRRPRALSGRDARAGANPGPPRGRSLRARTHRRGRSHARASQRRAGGAHRVVRARPGG